MKKLMFALMFMASSAFGVQGLVWDKDNFSNQSKVDTFRNEFAEHVVGHNGRDNSEWYSAIADGELYTGFFRVGLEGNTNHDGCRSSSSPGTIISLSGAEAGRYSIELYDSTGTKTAEFNNSVRKPSGLPSGKQGIALSLKLAAADDLAVDVTAPWYKVELSEANYATGHVEIRFNGHMGLNDSGLCYCAGSIHCSQASFKQGGATRIAGPGAVVLILPFKVETIP